MDTHAAYTTLTCLLLQTLFLHKEHVRRFGQLKKDIIEYMAANPVMFKTTESILQQFAQKTAKNTASKTRRKLNRLPNLSERKSRDSVHTNWDWSSHNKLQSKSVRNFRVKRLTSFSDPSFLSAAAAAAAEDDGTRLPTLGTSRATVVEHDE